MMKEQGLFCGFPLSRRSKAEFGFSDISPWGPYNKLYLGAAHVADRQKGLSFDLNLFPGYYSKRILLPKDNVDGGAKMIGASPDLSHYIYRYELQWQDEVYVDAEFISDHEKLKVICKFVNNTKNPESLAIDAVMSMRGCTQYAKEMRGLEVRKDENVLWIDAVDYTDICLDQKIAYDGLLLGEDRSNEFVSGSCLSARYFGKEGHFAEYRFRQTETDEFYIRYKGKGNLTVRTDHACYEVSLPQQDVVETYKIGIAKEAISGFTIYPHDAALELDGFVIGGNAEFYEDKALFIPEVSGERDEFEVSFPGYKYQVSCDAEYSVIRRLYTNDPGPLLLDRVHDNTLKVLGEDKNARQYIDLFIRPIFVEACSTKTVTITVSAPRQENFQACHELYVPKCNAEGKKYMLSQKIMSAVTLTNVVWPVYCRRGFICHNTPGRNWDSLYTWDSGFIGMGLAEMSIRRAKECLRMYLTEEDYRHSPYIFHGTPLPTQILLYADIYAKTGDKEFLKEFYPLIRRQYRFFADQRKTENIKETGLFSLWHIFYNSGGWDDYPTQVYVHKHGLEETVCPIVNTAFTVLCGRILRNLAEEIGADLAEYDEDIAFYSHAINTYAWDEQAGYYGYISHDKTPHILQIDGVNGNMGMDGVYPYIAGITDEEQSRAILQNVKEGMMTEFGVSVVDTRAPYFRIDGGWNGAIWMPHQWILWKALLDHGEIDLALEIAEKALNLWEKEVSITYDCYECFSLINGRGAGFHQFSGLSTPVLLWFSSLYKPYTVTCGFMSIVRNRKQEGGSYSFDVKLGGENPCILVCLEENREYRFITSGQVKKIGQATYVISNFKQVEEHLIATVCF